jgi:hypothetical protein
VRSEERRSVWPWLALGAAAVVVLIFLGSFVWRMLNPPVLPYVESEGPRAVIQVNVANASDVNGAGKRTLEFLRERGFDVVELSTASKLLDSSVVIDRVGDRASALKVALVLGIADSLVISDMDSMLFVRSSVIIGKDLQTLTPFAK